MLSSYFYHRLIQEHITLLPIFLLCCVAFFGSWILGWKNGCYWSLGLLHSSLCPCNRHWLGKFETIKLVLLYIGCQVWSKLVLCENCLIYCNFTLYRILRFKKKISDNHCLFRTAWQWLLGPGTRSWRFGTKWRRREDTRNRFLKCDQEQWSPNYQKFEWSEVLKLLAQEMWGAEVATGLKDQKGKWTFDVLPMSRCHFYQGGYWSSWWSSFMMHWSLSHS